MRRRPMFVGLAEAPHVAAVITNLADDLSLVDRMQDALAGEMQRRQELLRARATSPTCRTTSGPGRTGRRPEPRGLLARVADLLVDAGDLSADARGRDLGTTPPRPPTAGCAASCR